MSGNFKRENREIPSASQLAFDWERSANVSDGKADVHAAGKSDGSVVPANSANNDAAEASAESREGRDPAERNAGQPDCRRTPSRIKRESRGLHGVREAARTDRTLKFTALLHHVSEDCLREAFFELKKTAAVGVDGMTWHEYERNLEDRIADLHGRVHRGAYRAKPSLRIWIPKPDGRQRPIGIAALEDKIVQQAVVWVLQAIYEQDFLGFSYGFRPNRGCHQALDALTVAIVDRQVNWVLDADIAGFFDTIDHEWLIQFLEHRIGDQRVLRLIRKWLTAGVSEDGEWSETKVGTPQGAVISPLLANVFLHYVFDLWIEWWRTHHAQGAVVVVRYADDFVIGFQHQSEAQDCREALRQRFAKFGLTLHDEKTRLIEFGRYAAYRRKSRGAGRPETFDFLGFTHYCATTRHGRFKVGRRSIAQRVRRTLAVIKEKLRRRLHRPPGETGRWLGRVTRGWLNYHAIPDNSQALGRFMSEVERLWLQSLRRRSQKGRVRWTWARLTRLAARYLPRPHIQHPWPHVRFRARLEAGAV
jgi:group II intron reverse transcriptase/maturase